VPVDSYFLVITTMIKYFVKLSILKILKPNKFTMLLCKRSKTYCVK